MSYRSDVSRAGGFVPASISPHGKHPTVERIKRQDNSCCNDGVIPFMSMYME